MPKPNKNNDRDHIIYMPVGSTSYIVGAYENENPERGEIALRFPAFISVSRSGAEIVIEPFTYVETGALFTLYKTALLGSMAMPEIMRPTYDQYLEKKRAEWVAKK
jgi:hypothetical protein